MTFQEIQKWRNDVLCRIVGQLEAIDACKIPTKVDYSALQCLCQLHQVFACAAAYAEPLGEPAEMLSYAQEALQHVQIAIQRASTDRDSLGLAIANLNALILKGGGA